MVIHPTVESDRTMEDVKVDVEGTRPDETSCSVHIDPAAEARLLRKLDLHICPVLFFLYFLCYLDRSNIGNAKIQGMTQDLELDRGNRYNIALFVRSSPSSR